MRLAVDVEVRREPRDARLVGQGRVAPEVGPGLQIVRMGALPHAPDGPARETGADFRDRPQGRRRHELDLGCAVDVDELDQQVGDPVILKSALELDKLFFQVGHAYAGPFLGRDDLPVNMLCAVQLRRILDHRLLATATVQASKIDVVRSDFQRLGQRYVRDRRLLGQERRARSSHRAGGAHDARCPGVPRAR